MSKTAVTVTIKNKDSFNAILFSLKANGFRLFKATSENSGMCEAHIYESNNPYDIYYCTEKVGFLGLKEKFCFSYCETQYDKVEKILEETK